MSDDDTLRAVEAERLDLAAFLDDLDPADWDVASPCAGWAVRDVVAHLTLTTRLSVRAGVVGLIRARGSLDRMIRDTARRRAARYAPAELIGQLRETAGSPRRPPGTAIEDPLVDLLVHGQDIARPLGRTRTMPLDRVRRVLGHVWGSAFYKTEKRFRGLRLVATDLDWAQGDGAEVRGPAAELLLLMTGRPAGLTGLTGPGRDEAAARLAPSA